MDTKKPAGPNGYWPCGLSFNAGELCCVTEVVDYYSHLAYCTDNCLEVNKAQGTFLQITIPLADRHCLSDLRIV